MTTPQFIQENISCLKSAQSILFSLGEEQFSKKVQPFSGSIGQHLRHLAEHYWLFLKQFEQTAINYDTRQDFFKIEQSKVLMNDFLQSIIDQLEQLALTRDNLSNQSIKVLLSIDIQESPSPCSSTLGRELVFLHGHSVHHFAMISAIMMLQGLTPCPQLGFAPSTIKYGSDQTCAP